MNNIIPYNTDDFTIEEDRLRYFFVSKGKKGIAKMVEFTLIRILDGRKIFNLGFGDYDLVNDTIIDDVNSNNGDMRNVFSTVLSTIPKFFDIHTDAAILVQGSDSSAIFENQCRLTCRKNCTDTCKNLNKRIKAYRYYINRNFIALSKSYLFFGRMEGEADFVQYIPNSAYRIILVFKKK